MRKLRGIIFRVVVRMMRGNDRMKCGKGWVGWVGWVGLLEIRSGGSIHQLQNDIFSISLVLAREN